MSKFYVYIHPTTIRQDSSSLPAADFVKDGGVGATVESEAGMTQAMVERTTGFGAGDAVVDYFEEIAAPGETHTSGRA